MGRAKLSMELIKTEKGRQATFKKRKINLQKKGRELSILCGVKVCMIIYGREANSPEIWPMNEAEIKEMTKACREGRMKRVDVSHYFSDRQKKAEDMLFKIQKQNHEAKYPTWDYRYNDLSEQHLRNFASYLEGKIEAAMAKIAALKGKAVSTVTSCTDNHITSYFSNLVEPSLPSGTMDINACSSSYCNTNYYSNLLEPSLPLRIMDSNACPSSYTNTNYYSNLLEPPLPLRIMDINACPSSYTNTNYYSNLLEPSLPSGIMDINACSTNYHSNLFDSSEIMDNNISSSLYYNCSTNNDNLDAPNSYYHTSTTNANQLSDSEFLESLVRSRSMEQLEVLNPESLSSVNGQVRDTINHAPQQGLPFGTNNVPQFLNPSMMMLMNSNEPSDSNFMYGPICGPFYYDPTTLGSMSPLLMPPPAPTPTPTPTCHLAPMTLPGQFTPAQYLAYPSGTVEGSAQLDASQPNGFYQFSDFQMNY